MSAPKRLRKEVLRPGEVKVQAEYGRVTLKMRPADLPTCPVARCYMSTMPQNEFTLPQLKEFIAALQNVANDMELQEVHES